MPTMNPRITFTVCEEMRKQIEDYMFENRIKNTTQAIVSLINKGFQTVTGEPVQLFTEDEIEVVELYRQADTIYKGVAMKVMHDNPAEKKERHA